MGSNLLFSDIPIVPEATPGFSEWGAIDNMAVEVEVLEFLYGLVRCVKPKLMVECGSGRGFSTYAIGLAIAHNGLGELRSFEPDPRFAEEASRRTEGLPVSVIGERSNESLGAEKRDVDAVFLDSDASVRTGETRSWLEEPVFLIVHDSKRKEYALPDDGCALRTPRGLWFRDRRSSRS